MRKKRLPDTQTRLGTGAHPVLTRTAVEVVYKEDKFSCPYCLYTDSITKFLVKLKRGWSEKRAMCPDCGNLMNMATLTKSMSIEEYASWMVDAMSFKGWQRIRYPKLSQRLKEMGIASQFWDAYRKAKKEKAEGSEESYTEHMERKAQEYYENHKAEMEREGVYADEHEE